jgi:rhamnosyltransferase
MAKANFVGKMIEKTLPPATSFLDNACIIIPTYNAGRYWDKLHASLLKQGIQSDQVLVVDSSSTDNTRDRVRSAGYRLKQISNESFRHGATRQMASKIMPWTGFLVYLTQDAVPTEANSIKNLLDAFTDPLVGAAYGRQIPRDTAGPIEAHSRLFNYADTSETRTLDSRRSLGIKAAFCSNSFAAYRRTAFDEAGGFPEDSIFAEDVSVAARMLIKGWKIAYRADAIASHSHPLTVRKEFSRYFDIGVNHSREKWLIDEFGTAGGEGMRYVLSEMRFLWKQAPSFIPLAAIRTCGKWLGYQLGRHETLLPRSLVVAISAHPSFWNDHRVSAKSRPTEVEVPTRPAHAPRH